MIYILIFVGVILFHTGYEFGKHHAQKEKVAPVVHCFAYKGIMDDWMKKDRLIHHLEHRIFRLKRANRNLREEVRKVQPISNLSCKIKAKVCPSVIQSGFRIEEE